MSGMEQWANLYSHLRRLGLNVDIDEKLELENLFHRSDNDTVKVANRYTSINKAVAISTSLNGVFISELMRGGLKYTSGRQVQHFGKGTGCFGSGAGFNGYVRLVIYDDRQVVSNDQKASFYDKDEDKKTDITASGIDVVAQVGISFENGIWHALISGLLSAFCDLAHDGTIHFKQVSDLYGNIPVFLSRELVSVKMVSSMPSLLVDYTILSVVLTANGKGK